MLYIKKISFIFVFLLIVTLVGCASNDQVTNDVKLSNIYFAKDSVNSVSSSVDILVENDTPIEKSTFIYENIEYTHFEDENAVLVLEIFDENRTVLDIYSVTVNDVKYVKNIDIEFSLSRCSNNDNVCVAFELDFDLRNIDDEFIITSSEYETSNQVKADVYIQNEEKIKKVSIYTGDINPFMEKNIEILNRVINGELNTCEYQLPHFASSALDDLDVHNNINYNPGYDAWGVYENLLASHSRNNDPSLNCNDSTERHHDQYIHMLSSENEFPYFSYLGNTIYINAGDSQKTYYSAYLKYNILDYYEIVE